MYVSTTYEVSGDRESSDYSDVTGSGVAGDFGYKPGIISLTTEGVASIARKATIRFADPTTYVTKAILASSTWSNSVKGRGKPNIEITFGWKYLVPKSQTTSYYKSSTSWTNRDDPNVSSCTVAGMMMKTKFEINAQGVTEVEVEVMEVSGPIYGTASFLVPEDIAQWKLDYDEKIVKRNQDPIAVLQNFINKSKSLKITTGDGTYPSIQFEFSKEGFSNGGGSNGWTTIFTSAGASGGVSDIFGGIKIQYNEAVETLINEVFSKIPDRSVSSINDPGSYEIEKVYRAALDPTVAANETNNPIVTWIKYNWKKSVTLADGSKGPGISSRSPSFTFRWGNEGIWDENSEEGKSQYNTNLEGQSYSKRGAKKFLINWSSDLSSKTYLHFMAQTELQKALKQFDQKVMEYVVEQLQKGATISESGVVTYPSGSGPSSAQPASVDASGISNVIKGFSAAINSVTASASGGGNAQLASIVGNNMFKATATVMGDPDIGGEMFTPYKTTINVNFGETYFQNAFRIKGSKDNIENKDKLVDTTSLKAFSKVWLITKAIHKIDAGNYTTDVEMITYPNLS